jgi:hypothetical protein
METYNFKKDAKESDVWMHYNTLISGLQYHRRRGNETMCDAIRNELSQMKKVYPYLNI